MPLKLRWDSRFLGLGLAPAFLFLAGCGADQSDGKMDLAPEQIKKFEQGYQDFAKSGAYSDPSTKKVSKGAKR